MSSQIGSKHAQLRDALAQMIRDDLKVGDRLPGERRLVEQFGVSRITVRHAIAQLVADGLLVREHGRGTFVTHGMARSRLHLASFHEDMQAAGLRPTTAVDTVGGQPAPDAAAQHLGRSQALRIRRLRLGDGVPVSVDDSWVPLDLLPLDADWESSLYGMLARAGAPVTRAEQTVQAQAATPQDAALLGIDPGTPVLVFHRRSFTTGTMPDTDPALAERAVEYSISVYRADRYQLHMEVLA
ncbi:MULTISPECIES: GntR family transcriptional regulator [Kocuria]|uniref:GntR family transcriptional regulator n=1 Tax=Kocuria subflava TaxID=1736139 RepID=A0A846TSZ5_9MICC|nr:MULTISPECIES: GntR family transcriptional regulator [unclassified Kocuria]NKE08387.1 GntR family transcriptional regulator [Kocuria subflava]